jgi:hypothetical protein
MTITRAQFATLLEPKYSNIWNEAYPQRAVEYTAFVNIRTTGKAVVTDHKMTDFGPLRLKGEGEPIQFDDPIDGPDQTYTPVRFALGYKVTDEMLKNDLYGQITKYEKALIKSAVDGQETIAALLLNNGFSTTAADGFKATGFDGLQLFSTAHPRLDGGANQRNRPSTDVDISPTAVQNMYIDFRNLKDDRGRPSLIRPKLLIISPEDEFTAQEILQSEYKPGTANNDINALKDKGLSYMVSSYKGSNTDDWFAIGDTHDLNFVWETRPRSATEEDFDSEVIKHKVVQGFAVGFGEWRGTWGSSG